MTDTVRKSVFCCLVCAVVLCYSAWCVRAEENTSSTVQRAEQLFAEKKYPEALALYERVLEGDPKSISAYRRIVECYAALGDPQGAVVFMEGLYLDASGRAEVSYGMGYALYQMQRYEKALVFFEKALSLAPEMAEAWNNAAAIHHFVTKKYSVARTCYGRAIDLSRKSGNTRVLEIAEKNLANLPTEEESRAARERMSFEEFMNRFIALVDEGNERALRQLIQWRAAHARQAMEWLLNEAMGASAAGKPEEEATRVALARILEKLFREGHRSTALQEPLARYTGYSELQKKGIYNGEQKLREGLRQTQRHACDEALAAYAEALEEFTAIGDRYRMGIALLHTGDLHRTMKVYTKARKAYGDALTCFLQVRDEPQKAAALSSLGITSYYLGEHDEAIAFLKRARTIYRALGDREAERKVQKNIALIDEAVAEGSRN